MFLCRIEIKVVAILKPTVELRSQDLHLISKLQQSMSIYCNFRPSRDMILQQSMTHWYHRHTNILNPILRVGLRLYTNSPMNIASIRYGSEIAIILLVISAISHNNLYVYGLLQNWWQLERYNLSLSQDRPI